MVRRSPRGGFIDIDASGVSDLLGALKVLPAETKRQLAAAVREAAQLVAEKAKANIAPYSSWIGGAIEVKAPLSGATIATVRVDSSKAPSADHAPLPRLLEFGQSNSGYFRHPVWGSDNWVSQPQHRFLIPARDEEAPEVRALMVEAVREAARSVGLI